MVLHACDTPGYKVSNSTKQMPKQTNMMCAVLNNGTEQNLQITVSRFKAKVTQTEEPQKWEQFSSENAMNFKAAIFYEVMEETFISNDKR